MTTDKQQEQQESSRLLFWARVVFVAVMLCGIWHYLFVDRAIVDLTVDVDSKSFFKIYYKDAGGNWSERKMHEAYMRPGQKSYSFRLANLRNITELRIDPLEIEGEVHIHSLLLRQYGYQPLDVVQFAREGKLIRGDGVAGFKVAEEGIYLVSDSNDPQLFLSVPTLVKTEGNALLFLRLLFLSILAWLLVMAADKALSQYGYVAWLMLLVVVLAGVMAAISSYNAHPDEKVHVAAAQYYIDNTLPPAVGDPRAEGTYSGYGYSRLYSAEIAYFFAGKFAKFLQPLEIPDYLSFRYFNLTLLGILLCCACVNFTWRILLIPLLLSPQIWYVFSYWNSDALALFLILCAAWQLVAKESAWNKLLTRESIQWVFLKVTGLILLFTLLFFSKKNFYLFLLFAGIYVLHQFFFKKYVWHRPTFLSVTGIVLCSVSFFASFHLWNASHNDFERKSRIQEQVRIHADALYNPDTPLEEQHPFLYMKKRGVSLAEMMASRWGERSFRTSVGEYGYTSVSGSYNYYRFMRCALMLLGAAALFSVFFWGGWENRTLLFLTAGTGVSIIALSFYHSWTMDYQAQGRYLLPLVGVLSVFVYQARRQLENIVVISLAGLIFSGAVYSFIFVGLAGIGK